MFRICVFVALCVLAFAVGQTWADPLPGEILKFQQLPLNNGLPVINPYTGPYINTNGLPIPLPTVGGVQFPGHDELSTVRPDTANPTIYRGTYMADDFADRFLTPVVHVRWWGSYMNSPTIPDRVNRFLISFESDVPAVGTTPSHPGNPLLNQVVSLAAAPVPGSFSEQVIPGSGAGSPDGPLYQYNAELRFPFFENIDSLGNPKPDTIYWLKIVALADANQPNLAWGWHNRDWSIPDPLASVPPAVSPGEHVAGVIPLNQPVYHFQDD